MNKAASEKRVLVFSCSVVIKTQPNAAWKITFSNPFGLKYACHKICEKAITSQVKTLKEVTEEMMILSSSCVMVMGFLDGVLPASVVPEGS